MDQTAKLTPDIVRNMDYVDFMALLDETNRPPGGLQSIMIMLQNTFLSEDSRVLDVGCNTGYCSFEISRFIGCHVTGVDINKNMVDTATSNTNKFLNDERKSKVAFTVGDAKDLAFADNTFDLVMSGGSTAFVDDIPVAIEEYSRVCKPYGYVCDINFYYHTVPPTDLIKRLNNAMGTSIQPWKSAYWEQIYEDVGLEPINIYRAHIESVSDAKVMQYVEIMSERLQADQPTTIAIKEKLQEVMQLFNENHEYLASGVYLYRKNPAQYEPSLF